MTKSSGRELQIWSHLLKKSLMENFILCSVLGADEALINGKIVWEDLFCITPLLMSLGMFRDHWYWSIAWSAISFSGVKKILLAIVLLNPKKAGASILEKARKNYSQKAEPFQS